MKTRCCPKIMKLTLALVLALVQLVSIAGADPDLKKQLLDAAESGDVQKVNALLGKGADVNAADSSGRTAVMVAVENCDHKLLELLIQKGADINAKDQDGQTALMTAVVSCYPDILKLLLKNGADVNAKDVNGRTALMRLSSGDEPFDSRLSLDPPPGFFPRDGTQTSANKISVEMAKLLLDKGADVNARDRHGRTAIMLAVRLDQPAVVRVLEAHEAEISLTMAAMLGNKAKVQKFLEHGVDVNTRDPDGLTALMAAVVRGYREL